MRIEHTEAEYLAIAAKTLPKFFKIKPIRVDKKKRYIEELFNLGERLLQLCAEATDFHIDQPNGVGVTYGLKFNIDLEYFVETIDGLNHGWLFHVDGEDVIKYSKNELYEYFEYKDVLPAYISIDNFNLTISSLSSKLQIEQTYKEVDNISDFIKNKRQSSGLSAEEVLNELNKEQLQLTLERYNEIENGKTDPTGEEFLKIKKVLEKQSQK
ncbi:helix-turn-helix domain-containing protein [Chryseobacterium sp. LC2016-29]|uniref:helix-turn-helix domain-containing protein n=1 Tax=Chryseobacterium sp. LC2016-29 TaxID=2897331 RepID=UPI001E3F5FC3|nr:helix-turn-helix transcriptional regulator [Chryseobacterium sp. LC2016-29]MCD0480415.1 helix-turn-helix domain-containing protein [Chryseobacterium sp. LC2016-29]